MTGYMEAERRTPTFLGDTVHHRACAKGQNI